MADAYKGLTVRLGADTTALSKALRSAKGEVSGVAGELGKYGLSCLLLYRKS